MFSKVKPQGNKADSLPSYGFSGIEEMKHNNNMRGAVSGPITDDDERFLEGCSVPSTGLDEHHLKHLQ